MPPSLHGRRVVVTRSMEQAGELARLLEAEGAEVFAFPTLRIAPPEDPVPLGRALRRLASYDWLVLTSPNGVERFLAAADAARVSVPPALRIACVGPATAAALAARGLQAAMLPDEYIAEGLLAAFQSAGGAAGRRVLLAQAAAARPVLAEGLRTAGAEVDAVAVYRSVPVDGAEAEPLRRRIAAGMIDVVTFTSSSTVRNFLAAIGPLDPRVRVAVIGPATAATARESGLRVDAEAVEHTIPGLVRAVVDLFGAERPHNKP